MSNVNPPNREVEKEPMVRSPWFWLVTLIVPFVLFFAVLGVLSAIEKWHAGWPPAKENAALQEAGVAPWIPAERRAYLKQRIESIDQEIPVILGEAKFLDEALKKEQARVASNPHAQKYVDFIEQQEKALKEHIDFLRSDRAFYIRELHEK